MSMTADDVNRRMDWPEPDPGNTEPLLTREWLVTNGLGGYASGTVAGVATRRYHGLLIAALPAPHGRTVMLNHLAEQVRLPDGTVFRFGGERARRRCTWNCMAPASAGIPPGRRPARLALRVDGFVLEKQILLVHRQNTVHIHYRLVEGEGPIRL